jgi:hypothetical protein
MEKRSGKELKLSKILQYLVQTSTNRANTIVVEYLRRKKVFEATNSCVVNCLHKNIVSLENIITIASYNLKIWVFKEDI